MTNAIAELLAAKALTLNGAEKFATSIGLNSSNPESFQAFEVFKEMLLMAYYDGQHSVLASRGK